ncbi:MAG: 50S ribosomal protein L19 [Waddliaceae bacterium]|nr:50S ribosomal protein L19 [Waddliaceae bacterium]
MSKNAVIERLEKENMKDEIPEFFVGDTVRVHMKIVEGSKERIQVFQGTVIARTGSGLGETFSIHRVAFGEGMERVFPLHSPRIEKIEIVREGDVRRAKLYYLRGKKGKKARIRSRVVSRNAAAKKKSAANELSAEVEAIEVEITNEEVVNENVNANESTSSTEESNGDTKA